MNLDLSGKRALVCGASQGLGEACARQLAEQGAEVVILARSQDKLERVCQSLASKVGQSHGFIAVDASDTAALVGAVSTELSRNGPVQIWINNTGGPAPGPAHLAEPAAYAAAFSQHLVSAQSLLQLLLPGMREASYGRILNILSTSVKQPIANLGVSNSIRAAMANWAKTLAAELGSDGITVNNVLPGLTRTARLDGLIAHIAQTGGRSTEQVTQGMLAAIPARRFAEPEEFANAVGFLASPAAAYINGINVPVDGGSTGNL
ncbi:MAG TPA: SDR family oxidoreductase [Pseudomonas xinjiangensis]|uniref:SDR family oxidoreductase n=2 Tax=root TaxID=1 RepID=A0A7V1BQG6_9GAMM|nr:SDR family oxidoreductase [Halopseudomonas xinjiangensis]HEC46696.1 SDR family oxidoreductase [Halopseudomonas xinjiangensis]